MLLLAALPLMAQAQTELTPEQEVEKARKELEAAQKKLALAQERARQEAERHATLEAGKVAQAQERVQKNEERRAEATQEEPVAGWSVPQAEELPVAEAERPLTKEARKISKEEELAPYLAADAVPLVDGKVEWSCTVEVPGERVDALFDKCKKFLTDLTRADNTLKESRVALLNAREHSVIASMREELTISSTYLSLNHPTLGYVLQATCKDGKATLTMSRLTYNYDKQGQNQSYKAEEWITDDVSLSKDRTRLQPLQGKMRRKTIDRKNELFKQFEAAVKG